MKLLKDFNERFLKAIPRGYAKDLRVAISEKIHSIFSKRVPVEIYLDNIK